jgi:adenosylhomocysteine nucleosidase
MDILVLEDQDDKFALIDAEIRESYKDTSIKLVRADHFAIATKYIYKTKFDLIVIDLMMPLRKGDAAEDISEDIISILELSSFNRVASVVALSGFDDLVDAQRQRFTEAGIILVHYDETDERWKKYISAALAKIREQVVFDFVIVCALEKERAAYKNTIAKVGELRNIRGLDCMSLDLGPLKGVCVKLPRMGLV